MTSREEDSSAGAGGREGTGKGAQREWQGTAAKPDPPRDLFGVTVKVRVSSHCFPPPWLSFTTRADHPRSSLFPRQRECLLMPPNLTPPSAVRYVWSDDVIHAFLERQRNRDVIA